MRQTYRGRQKEARRLRELGNELIVEGLSVEGRRMLKAAEYLMQAATEIEELKADNEMLRLKLTKMRADSRNGEDDRR